jgi:NAD(P)-dependent dehydrogenase (short-subunit alcohol dehydrogenase family)
MSGDSILRGKTALITGAAQGIGKAISRVYANAGAVVIVADVQQDKGLATAAELGATAQYLPCNVTNAEEVNSLVETVVSQHGHLDILVNNAAYNPVKTEERVSVEKYPEEVWLKVMDVDINGTFYCSKTAATQMLKQKSGCIINIASTSGIVSLRNQIAHVTAKAAIIRMTEAMALELSPRGVRVNCISPGSTVTEATSALFYGQDAGFKEYVEKFMTFIPLGRPAQAEEIGQAALFLASESSKYITGHNLVVDGGWTCGFTRNF